MFSKQKQWVGEKETHVVDHGDPEVGLGSIEINPTNWANSRNITIFCLKGDHGLLFGKKKYKTYKHRSKSP